jgi:hypothetical protein
LYLCFPFSGQLPLVSKSLILYDSNLQLSLRLLINLLIINVRAVGVEIELSSATLFFEYEGFGSFGLQG